MASRTLVIRTKMENKDFHAQIKSMENELERLKGDYEAIANGPGYSNQQKDLQDLETEIEKATNKLKGLKEQQEKIDNHGFENFGKGMTNIVKKVGRWTMALFGVRTAMSIISNATSRVAQNNEEVASKIEGIKNALAGVLEPIIIRIVNLVEILLGFIGSVAKAWFGVDIFANRTAKATQKATSSAKELRKTLAGFDEMNVLNDDGSTGIGGALGSGIPDYDPSQSISKFNEFITTIKTKWTELGKDMETALNDPKMFDKAYGNWGGLIYEIVELFHGLWDVIDGTIDVVGGAMAIIVGIVTGNTELIRLGFEQMGKGIAKNFKGIIEIITGTIKIVRNLLQNLMDFVKGPFINVMYYLFGDFGAIIGGFFGGVVTSILSLFDELLGGVEDILGGILKLFSGDFKDGLKQIMDGILKIIMAPVNALINGINVVIRALNKIKGVNIPEIGKIETSINNEYGGGGGGGTGFAKGGIVKCATGAIVNRPGMGVPVSGAIAGERGMEGIFPLTDSQQMELLGSTIGKYINLNATIPVYVGNRQIAREIKRINTQNDFSYNR